MMQRGGWKYNLMSHNYYYFFNLLKCPIIQSFAEASLVIYAQLSVLTENRT